MNKQISALFLVMAFLTACKNKEERNANSEKAITPLQPVSNHIVGIGRVVPQRQIIQLAVQVNGILAKIFKDENQIVFTNEEIAELVNDVEKAQFVEAQLKANTQRQQVNIEEATLKEYKIKLDNAESEYRRLKILNEKGAETKQALDNSETEYKLLQATINRLYAQIDIAKSQLNECNAGILVAKLKLDQTKIKSPFNGKILEWKVKPGEGVNTLQAVAQIAPDGGTVVESEIDEALALKVKVGQVANVRYLGASEYIGSGRVYFISNYLKKKSLFFEQSGEAEDRRVRVVKVMLKNSDGILLNSRVETIINEK